MTRHELVPLLYSVVVSQLKTGKYLREMQWSWYLSLDVLTNLTRGSLKCNQNSIYLTESDLDDNFKIQYILMEKFEFGSIISSSFIMF